MERSVLVEFINDDNDDDVNEDSNDTDLGVIICQWIKGDPSDDNVNKLIEEKETVLVYWPQDVGKKSMKSLIKNSDDVTWDELPAKILAFGNWTDMVAKRNKLEKCDTLNTSKSKRKEFCKKKYDTESEDDDDEELTEKPNKLKKKTNTQKY